MKYSSGSSWKLKMQPVANPMAYPILNQQLEQLEQSIQYYPEQKQEQQQQQVAVIYEEHADLMGANSYQDAYNQGVWSNPRSWHCGAYCGYGDSRSCVPNPAYYDRSISNRTGCSCCRYVANCAHPRFQCSVVAFIFLFSMVTMISVVGFIY